MRYRILVVLASVAMLLPGVTAAQDDETWYFAWKPETGEVVAYTAAGAVKTILEGGVEWSFTGWRLDSRTVVALIVSIFDREVSVYRLTPESAQTLAFLFDADNINSPTNRPDWLAAYSFPYMVFAIGYQPPFEGLLINVDTGTVEALENLTIWSLCCRFSKDGRYLRYITVEEISEGVEYTLRERTLENGNELVVHRIDAGNIHALLFRPDLHGSRWLYDEFSDDGENTTHTVTMLFPDGTSEVVAEEEYYYLRDRHEWEFIGDNLAVLSNGLCERDCSLTIALPDAETPIDFILPPLWIDGTIGSIRLLPQVTSGSALINQGLYDYWQLKPDQDAVFIGKSSNYTMGEISHTGRWLLVTDDEYEPYEYRVWDNLNEQYVLTDEEFVVNDTPVEMVYNDESVLVQSIHTGAGKLYRSTDDTTFELSGEPVGSYFEILADGMLLYQQSNDRDDRPSGIYLYDPTSASYTLLVQGASHFWLEPIFFF